MDNQEKGKPVLSQNTVVGESKKFNLAFKNSPPISFGNKSYISSKFAIIYDDATNLLPVDADTTEDSPPVTPTEVDSPLLSLPPDIPMSSEISSRQPVPQSSSSQDISPETPSEIDLQTPPPVKFLVETLQPVLSPKPTSSHEKPVTPLNAPEVTPLVILFTGVTACLLAATWKWLCIDVYHLAFVGAVVNLVTLDL